MNNNIVKNKINSGDITMILLLYRRKRRGKSIKRELKERMSTKRYQIGSLLNKKDLKYPEEVTHLTTKSKKFFAIIGKGDRGNYLIFEIFLP